MLTLSEIKEICDQYGIKPSKSKGQNFLFDQNVAKKIIAAAALTKGDTVLEVGPGLGVLTADLLARAGRVVAVELDQKIIAYLNERYASAKLELVAGDILQLTPVALKLTDYKIVANLPYNITANFLRKFLAAQPAPREMVLMVQQEVAARLTAAPGEMSLLAVATQFYARPEILFKVSRNSFWPAPKVDSAVIKLKLAPKQAYKNQEEFFRIVKIGFSAKRKQLQNNLANGLRRPKEEMRQILRAAGFDEKIRAQDLGVADWIKIVKALNNP